MSTPQDRWKVFDEKLQAALFRSNRSISELQILAVSKKQSVEKILNHIKLIKEFPLNLGENYFQELCAKMDDSSLQGLGVDWHYIGVLQSKKIASISSRVKAIHSVAREKELLAMSQLLKSHGKLCQFYLQFNVSGESTKNGFVAQDAQRVLDFIGEHGLVNHLEGFMTSAAPLELVGETVVRSSFEMLRNIRDKSFPKGKLNMGMSSDFEIAILEGANVLRLGSILFGER